MVSDISLPVDLIPKQPNFGCGPTAIRKQAVAKLAQSQLLGTSHRQKPVRDLVGQIRSGIGELLGIPTDYEVIIGNGGATTMWAINAACLIKEQASVGVYGAFSSKCATEIANASFLNSPLVSKADPGDCVLPKVSATADTYCWAHNETSTGVRAPLAGVKKGAREALTLVDATSIAGAVAVDDWSDIDCYYFSPQKVFAADGGLWLAICSPQAVERAHQIVSQSQRWIPAIIDFTAAYKNSLQNQTVNTPAIATLELLASQVEWLNNFGSISAVEAHVQATSQVLYEWAENTDYVRPFVTNPNWRSPVVVTLEFSPDVSAAEVVKQLRLNGIIDVNPYRGVGANQLRVGCFPVTTTADTQALTACIDYVVTRL